ncbi:MAG: hypothetical protein GY722_08830 [bacterium]|nr:hypothetical protein [bacterium]
MMRSLMTGMGSLLLLSGIVLAQTSTSYTLEEYTFNGGGAPAQGVQPASAGYSITIASIGDDVVATGMSGGSFQLDAGFDVAYPPPGEVATACGDLGEACLMFTDADTLNWPGERSAGVYNLYRDLHSSLLGLGFGQCEQQDLGGVTATDSDPVPTGDGFFYLVTAENRLGEEGTKGFRFEGVTAVERGGAVCP